ncbi:Pikachurin [Taenia crassiceps]|uniref:Pikachurin n=1 Tax=Taenia crassiceps TaxID=6207 RepID=A0ABR4Q7E1_9CEST
MLCSASYHLTPQLLLAKHSNRVWIYNKSREYHFYLPRLLQHPIKLHNANASFFDIAFGSTRPNEFSLSVNQHEVRRRLEDIPPESRVDFSMRSFGNEHPIYVGGHLTLSLGNPFPIVSAAENSLIGCVGDININGHLCDPRQSSFVGDAIGGFGIVDCARNVCNRHTCEGGSFCKPISSTEYACQCPIGTRPPWCKPDRVPIIPEFLGNSYLSVRGFRDTSWTETLIEITFLPKEATGLIIYSGYSFDTRGDFICVALVNGRIIVSLDLGHGPSFKKSSQNLTLNSWHTLRVKRRGRGFDIYLNGEHTASGPEAFTRGNFVQLTITDELYVGGNPNPDRISAYLPDYHELVSYKSVKGFFGCIQTRHPPVVMHMTMHGPVSKRREKVQYGAPLSPTCLVCVLSDQTGGSTGERSGEDGGEGEEVGCATRSSSRVVEVFSRVIATASSASTMCEDLRYGAMEACK